MIEISRDYVFQAAHHLPGTPGDHKCHGMHGHTWEVRLVVTGPIDPITGWIVDYAELDKVWNEVVHDKLDHSVLNETITNPTTEHICLWIYATTAEKVSAIGARVVRIEITEGGRGRAVLHVETNEVLCSGYDPDRDALGATSVVPDEKKNLKPWHCDCGVDYWLVAENLMDAMATMVLQWSYEGTAEDTEYASFSEVPRAEAEARTIHADGTEKTQTLAEIVDAATESAVVACSEWP